MPVFLVPMLIDEVDALICTKPNSTAGPFYNAWEYLEARPRTAKPQLDEEGNLIWVTRGKGRPFPGGERGYVFADVGQYGKIQFIFNNQLQTRLIATPEREGQYNLRVIYLLG